MADFLISPRLVFAWCSLRPQGSLGLPDVCLVAAAARDPVHHTCSAQERVFAGGV